MKTELPPILETKLADFRQRVWTVKLIEGLLAAGFGLALSYLLVFALDRVMETPVWLRASLLIAGALTLGLGLPLKWHRWVWRQRQLEDAARLLKRTFPRLGDQLLGIVELSRHEDAARSERLVQAAMAQAAEAVKDKDFTHAVPEAKHVQWGWAAGLTAMLAVAALALLPDAAWNALARWVTPWRDVERFTFAKIEKLPERLVVPYAEPFDLKVQLQKDTRWSPASAKARISDQPVVMSGLKDGTYPLAFPPQKSDTELKLSLGDVRKTVSVLPRTRPELTTLSVRTRLPQYLQYKTEPVTEVHGGAVSVLKGAEAALEATASRELASAEVDGAKEKVSGAKIVTPLRKIDADVEKRVMWQDQDGLTPREPLVLRINAIEDEAPRLAARRETPEQVVLDSEVVAFDMNVEDDFGIRRTGLEWRSVNDDKTKGEKIAAAGEPEKKTLAAKATFCASRDGVEPQTLEIRAWAEDYLPNRKRAYSAAFVLHVLNKTDHALWLTEQFGKWLEAARETYEREQQLHATNKELRQMTAAELDRPENRRKIAQQASAENANATRLSTLNQSGRNLVEQATRNDEFDAARLESWATMLKSLQEIAKKKMPSVAELLKESSGAKAGAKSESQNAENSPSGSNKPSDGQKPQDGESKAGKPSAPQIANGPDLPKGSQGGKASTEEQKKANMPSITDKEGSMSKPEPQPADPNATPSPPKPSTMKLPTTQMAAAPSKKKDREEESKPAETQAQQKMDEAIDEQKLLLAEFAKVSDELAAVLASLEASTFVKRLKKASRDQLVAAKDLNTKTLSAFGLERQPVKDAAVIAEHEKKQSEVVRVIQGDLEAYYARKPEMHFKNVIGQMKETQVVKMLAYLGDQAAYNLSGSSMAGAEFWADTLDRWAEEMVAASECKSCSSCSSDSLPPEIVLKVMKATRDEMKLRDETRELENSKPALANGEHAKKSADLASKQYGIQAAVRGAFDDILKLPQGNEKFGRELKLLNAVQGVMMEAAGILDKADTGDAAIAAETEAIELLLQAKRQGKGGGGGGGGSPGGGGTAASASEAALADLGDGSDVNANVDTRPVGQSTGKAGRELPEEFKAGLDSYFNKLESGGAVK
ncbi:hypothetical protein [Prosthecobacter sp.]|jgi:hypothetical protein|uniref:hypothetical protein n=1 Tax=Prosthecobacter sp. TaxID=1965333 RepID=UPI003782E929